MARSPNRPKEPLRLEEAMNTNVASAQGVSFFEGCSIAL